MDRACMEAVNPSESRSTYQDSDAESIVGKTAFQEAHCWLSLHNQRLLGHDEHPKHRINKLINKKVYDNVSH